MQPQNIAFDQSSFTLLLNINHADVEGLLAHISRVAGERGLAPKKEFHSTVVGFGRAKKIKELYAHLAPEELTKVGHALKALAESIDWGFNFSEGEIFYIEKEYQTRQGSEKRSSIIQLLSMPGMVDFYARLNGALNTSFEVPPPHVTLYTTSTNPQNAGTGIGIDSQVIFDALKPENLICS